MCWTRLPHIKIAFMPRVDLFRKKESDNFLHVTQVQLCIRFGISVWFTFLPNYRALIKPSFCCCCRFLSFFVTFKNFENNRRKRERLCSSTYKHVCINRSHIACEISYCYQKLPILLLNYIFLLKLFWNLALNTIVTCINKLQNKK